MIYQTWDGLNRALMSTTSEEVLDRMLREELALSDPRKMFALRIHSRLNKMRGERERAEIIRKLKR